MKEFFQKFNLTEFFTYLAPGVIVLLSATLWWQPDFEQIIGTELAEQSLVIGFLLFIISYTLGFIISWWGNLGASRYYAWLAKKEMLQKEGNASKRRKYY